jgi:hypothetical protein
MRLAPVYAFPQDHPAGIPGPVRFLGAFTFHNNAQLAKDVAAKLQPGEVACAYPEGDSIEVHSTGAWAQ